MSQINCGDCLKTYQPYSKSVALLRVLVYGFSDWWEFEDELIIREHLHNPKRKHSLINKIRTHNSDDSFPADFNFYYHYLVNKRRKNISATFLCFDCEKYYCTNCVSKHSGHFTFSKDDKYDISKWGTIGVDILEKLKAEGDQKLNNMGRERNLWCDIVDLRCKHDKLDLDYALPELKWIQMLDDHYEFVIQVFDRLVNPTVQDLHILHDNKNWLVTDDSNKCIKIFSVNDNKMSRCIKLSSSPDRITEILSTNSSQTLIAGSFPGEKQIHIMNLHSTPAQVVSSINAQGRCDDLAYCNNKLITMCKICLDGKWHHLIHVMDISGKIINIIDLNNLPGFKLERIQYCRMSVHAESETIYVFNVIEPSCVISLSLDGQVLHSVTFTDLKPLCICVDKDQNVYVASIRLPVYKLSADLRHREKVIDEDIVKIPSIKAMRFQNDKFYLMSHERHVYIIQHE